MLVSCSTVLTISTWIMYSDQVTFLSRHSGAATGELVSYDNHALFLTGIDTDKYKYPIGSARVTFNNYRSYMKAVSAAFIEIKTAKFTKKVQVDPYLEDALCNSCQIRQGPYFCRDLACFKYFCRSCWEYAHEMLCHHKPLMRNCKHNSSTSNNHHGTTSSGGASGSSSSHGHHRSMLQSASE